MLSQVLSNFDIYYLDSNSIVGAAEIYKKLRAKGKLIDHADILMASIAIANNQTLLTVDKDFEKIDRKEISIIKI